MKHWKPYIERQKPEYKSVALPPELNAGMVVVIPCFNEPSLFETLHSLRACSRPKVNVLTVIVFNSGEHSDEKVVEQNRLSFEQTLPFADKYNEPGFHYFPLLFGGLPRKHAGVGLARKIGMDLAVEHFLHNVNPGGVIVSLDADCTVSKNFLVTIYEAFSDDTRLNASLHNFFHRVEKNDPLLENAVRQYELYIHYFRQMLRETGFPYYHHTIGSAFAITADAYVRVGGMGRQQGGEDFYFLQKVFTLGNVKELNDTFVYPMARFSDRIPFGTGPALQKIMEEPDGIMRVYSRKSFHELRRLFEMKDSFFRMEDKDVLTMIAKLDSSLADFLQMTGFSDEVADCNRNSASLATFQKRFFQHFNAFRIIKYLNFSHPDPFPYEKISIVADKY
ncbi:MAG: glycosyltransferase [Proteiniphilum sp.]|nr:glycosyltransferase [Proteiniphilum sp.]